MAYTRVPLLRCINRHLDKQKDGRTAGVINTPEMVYRYHALHVITSVIIDLRFTRLRWQSVIVHLYNDPVPDSYLLHAFVIDNAYQAAASSREQCGSLYK